MVIRNVGFNAGGICNLVLFVGLLAKENEKEQIIFDDTLLVAYYSIKYENILLIAVYEKQN